MDRGWIGGVIYSDHELEDDDAWVSMQLTAKPGQLNFTSESDYQYSR
jgi:hypothetical protein